MTSAADLRTRALGLALSGRAGVEAQRRAVGALLDTGAACAPAEVVATLEAHAGTADAAAVARLGRQLDALAAHLIVVGDDDYPAQLADVWPELGAPLWIFVAGVLTAAPRRPAVAVVGTRAPSLDGLRTARAVAGALADAGVVVVSGLARGIDQAAHRGALDAGGATVAVLGTGLAVDYPARSAPLRAAIAADGALVTELPPGVGPRPWQFLERNRIISGLADAVVVVEGRARSGALQTARLAAGQGRDVWAVPGSINAPASAAPLALLRDGAIPLTDIGDLVASVTDHDPLPARRDPPADRPAPVLGLSPTAATVLDLLGVVPSSTEELVAAGRLPAQDVMVALGELTERGVVAVTPRGAVRT